MANFEQRQEKITKAKEILVRLSTVDPKILARTEDLSRDINFIEAVPHLEGMFDIIKQLNDRDISRLPSSQLDQVHTGSTHLDQLVEKIKNFSLNQNTPADVCKTIIKEVKDAYDRVMDGLMVSLAFTATQATDYAKIEREAKGYHATMKEEHGKLMQELEKVRVDANRALTAVQEQAAQAGVSTNAQIFAQNAKSSGDEANKWMKATIALAAVTLLTAISFFWAAFYYIPETSVAVVQQVFSKIILLSTLSFGIFWCARNYKSLKHNQTLNLHRANALMTFKAFLEGTTDDRVKDAILIHAAQAAFAPRPTGFDSPEKEIPAFNPIVEVLGRSLSKAG